MAKPTTPATILLLQGEERVLVDDKAGTTLEAWRSELVSDFGFDRLEGQGLSAARLQDSVLQAPFLDPFRVVAVTMVPAARAEGLASALVEVPTSTKLLITVAGRLGGGNRLAKSVAAAGGKVEEMLHLKGRALSEWAARRATDHGLWSAPPAHGVAGTPPRSSG